MKIIFTNTANIPEEYSPIPASKFIPDWYKDLSSYLGGEKRPDGQGQTTATAKKCMPIFDSISSGYIVQTPADVYISQKPIDYKNKAHFEETGENISLTKEEIKDNMLPETMPYYEWSGLSVIEFHPIEQAPNHPYANNFPYPKWINYWGIKTPKGYSCLFLPPMHRESVFTILPGIVDTDKYTAPVNFPFILNNSNFEGLIPAGTPIAQVIPFKRDNWKMEQGTQQDFIDQSKISIKLKTRFFDTYKTSFRSNKEYK